MHACYAQCFEYDRSMHALPAYCACLLRQLRCDAKLAPALLILIADPLYALPDLSVRHLSGGLGQDQCNGWLNDTHAQTCKHLQ